MGHVKMCPSTEEMGEPIKCFFFLEIGFSFSVIAFKIIIYIYCSCKYCRVIQSPTTAKTFSLLFDRNIYCCLWLLWGDITSLPVLEAAKQEFYKSADRPTSARPAAKHIGWMSDGFHLTGLCCPTFGLCVLVSVNLTVSGHQSTVMSMSKFSWTPTWAQKKSTSS